MISSHVHSTRLCHLSVENEDVRYHNASFESSGKNNSSTEPTELLNRVPFFCAGGATSPLPKKKLIIFSSGESGNGDVAPPAISLRHPVPHYRNMSKRIAD